MDDHAADQIMGLIRAQRFQEALARLRVELQDQKDWYGYYMVGLAYRGIDDFASAVFAYLTSLNCMPDDVKEPRASVLLDLGIALQHEGKYRHALHSLGDALQLSPRMIAVYNSLGMTFRLMERHEEALGTYDAGISCLLLEVYENLVNVPLSEIVEPHRSTATLWIKKAFEVANELAQAAGISKCAIATETTPIPALHRTSGGFFFDVPSDDGGIRQLLPFYFNAVYGLLRRDVMYATLTNNLGGVLTQLGRREEAIEVLQESIEFIPDGVDYQPPYIGLEQLGVRPRHR